MLQNSHVFAPAAVLPSLLLVLHSVLGQAERHGSILAVCTIYGVEITLGCVCMQTWAHRTEHCDTVTYDVIRTSLYAMHADSTDGLQCTPLLVQLHCRLDELTATLANKACDAQPQVTLSTPIMSNNQ